MDNQVIYPLDTNVDKSENQIVFFVVYQELGSGQSIFRQGMGLLFGMKSG